MSRIATVKETGLELSEEEWTRFEVAVASTVFGRPEPWPFARGAKAIVAERSQPNPQRQDACELCLEAAPHQP